MKESGAGREGRRQGEREGRREGETYLELLSGEECDLSPGLLRVLIIAAGVRNIALQARKGGEGLGPA